VKVKDLYQSAPRERGERLNLHIVQPPQPIIVAPQVTKKCLDSEKPESAADPTEGRIVAVLIASEVLGADVWFSLDDSFNPGDGLAVFYADELGFLKSKDAQTLRKIHETKLAFGPGSRVRQ
jgi:hypothetical protein